MPPDLEGPSPAAKCRYPFLLLHGFLGFVEKRIGPVRLTYFKDVVPYLEAAGNRAYAVGVHPRKCIEHRAEQIRDFIESHEELREGPINLIGHSMGGLDARYLIARMGYGDRVRSLTTLSSPHHGSFLADIGSRIPGFTLLFPAVKQLTEKHMAEFNRETPDDERIRYYCVPASARYGTCRVFMWPSYTVLRALRGENDGQVSVRSATWGEVLHVCEVDHLRMIGMTPSWGFPRGHHLETFGKITRKLAEEGF
jgi:triacylglycerol lipase